MRFFKIKFIIAAFIVFFVSFDAQAKDFDNFYYAFKEKIKFIPLPNKIIIKKNEKMKSSDYEEYLKSSIKGIKIEWIAENVCKISLSSGMNDEMFETILSNTETASIRNMNKLEDGLEFGFTNEIVIKFTEGIEIDKRNEILNQFNLQKIRSTKVYELCTVDKYADVLETANALFETGMFEFAYPNVECQVELTAYYPNDPYFKYQVALHNTGQLFTDDHTGNDDADIDMPEAWDITKGSNNIVIAVIDQGVTSNHPDLPNTRQVRLKGSNFGSGNVDDPSPTGNDSHGNACAGIIAATMNNNEGITGIAPNCKIMPLRTDMSTTTIQMADAILFATDNGANIISNSWSYNSSNSNIIPVIVSAIQYTINQGTVVVFSVGNTAEHTRRNNGYVAFPANANINSLISVGASDRYDKQSDYSPTSHLIDVVAPSHRAYPTSIGTETLEMWSLDIPDNFGYNPWPAASLYPHPPVAGTMLPNSGANHLAYTGRFGGTSFSCPVVAGIAALILSIKPDLTPLQVYNILIETTDKIGGYSYVNNKCNQTGFGRVNAYKAVLAATNSCNLTGIQPPPPALYKSVTCEEINIDATVPTGTKLELNAHKEVNINMGFEIQAGAEFEINITP